MSDESRLRRLAWVWLALVLSLLAWGSWQWLSGRLQVETDVLAMLPQDPAKSQAQAATRALADGAERRVIVLVGAADVARAQAAGDVAAAQLDGAGIESLRYRVGDAAAGVFLDFYAPHAQVLLDAPQRVRLEHIPIDVLAQQAQAQLYQPMMGLPRVGSFASDPLNTFGAWLSAHGRDSRVRVVNGRLMVEGEGKKQYAVLMLTLADSAFSVSAGRALNERLDAARRAVLPLGAELHAVGVPLFASAASEQAQSEVHVIGAGSLIGIVLLTWAAFGGLRPRLLVALSIAVGLLAAVSITSLFFGKLHLITLVFGASLVGVAENYGSNYFSNRAGRPLAERFVMLGEQWGTLWLALATTVIGYALLALTPFPGLRQIAVFSSVGLVAAFITTLLWFPVLDGGSLRLTRFARWMGALRARWPRGKSGWVLVAVLLVSPLGVQSLHVNDDIRALQNAPAALIAEQQLVSRLMDLPTPSRFFLVQGRDAQETLEREEALVALLRSYEIPAQAVSDWLPSLKQQRADLALRERVDARVLAEVSRRSGERIEPPPLLEHWITPEAWLASPVSEVARHLWLGNFEGGPASVVMLRGNVGDARLASLTRQLPPGVRWVDKVADISEVMQRTRQQMTLVLAVSAVLVLAVLLWRFGRQGWRALVPTLIAGWLAVLILSLLGQPLQLFNVLALLLILGMGVDYGIFLLSQPGRAAVRPFLSITLAAASSLLAFGLLALSGTPALRAFGLTMLLGLSLAWFLTPFFVGSDEENDEN